MMNTTTNTTTYTRAKLNEMNRNASKLFVIDIVNAKNHLAMAYSRKLEVLRAASSVPEDKKGEAAHEFTEDSINRSFVPASLSILRSARPLLKEDVEDLAALFVSDNSSMTSAKNAFVAFIEKHNGGESAPYAEVAAKELFKSCKKVKVDRKVADMTPAEVRSTFNASLIENLYSAFNGVAAKSK